MRRKLRQVVPCTVLLLSALVLVVVQDSAADAPPLVWESEYGTGLNALDGGCELKSLGFAFNFYGAAYTDVWINSDGNLTFDDCNDQGEFFYGPIPDGSKKIIAPLYGDFNPEQGGDVYYKTVGVAPDRVFLATWSVVPEWFNVGSNTFQVQLFEGTDQILFGYNSINTDGFSYSTTSPVDAMNVGISSGDGSYINSASGHAIPGLDYTNICYAPVGSGNYLEYPGVCGRYPVDGATGVSVVTDLYWIGGDPGDTVTYDVYLDENSTPSTLVCDDSPTPTCEPGVLDVDTQYYWYFVATDGDGSTTASTWSFTTVPTVPSDPPHTPSDPSPSDGSVGVLVTEADLLWTGGDPNAGDTVTYDVYFEAGDITPDSLLCDNASSPTCDHGTLDLGTHYYWYVVATDNHGASTTGPTWDFTTNAAPNTPGSPSPADDATGVSITANLSWIGGDPDPGDTVTYDVYFEAGGTAPEIAICEDVSSTTCDPGTLEDDSEYTWYVIATDNHGASTTGSTWEFTTGAGPNDPPDTPSSPSPADGATGVSITTDLSWTGGDPDAGDTVTYDVFFEASGAAPEIAICEDVSSTTCDPGTLDYDSEYTWYVIATDNHGASTTGSTWDFTTGAGSNDPPNTPSSPSPADDATGVSITANLSWIGGDPDVGDTVTYDVFFEASGATPTIPICDDVSATTCSPGTLDYDSEYSWYVIATDNHGASTTGSTWDFTTGAEPNDPPNTPSSPSPADAATGVSTATDLSWTGGDPDAGDTVTYDVYFEASGAAPEIAICEDVSSTTCHPGTLEHDSEYTWYVIATDNHGASTTGSTWDFTTGAEPNDPPNTPSSPSPADDATGVSITANLAWTGGDPDALDTVTYDVYFDADDSTPSVLLCNDSPTPTCDPGTLEYDTHYYWTVLAADNHGASTTGPTWDFATTDGSDAYEPDNTWDQATSIGGGAPQTHSILPVADVDWVEFSLSVESEVVIETSGPSGDTRMWLYDSSLNELEYNDNGGTSSFSRIDRLCGTDGLPAGTYYVKIDEAGNDDDMPSYDVSFTILGGCGGNFWIFLPEVQRN